MFRRTPIPPERPSVLAARLAWEETYLTLRYAGRAMRRVKGDADLYRAAFRLWLLARADEGAAWQAYNTAIMAH